MKHFTATIQTQEQIAKDYYCMVFTWEKNEESPLPGRFVTIRVSDTTTPLLRRPFAFSGYNSGKEEAAIIYQKRGVGTEILSGKQKDDTLDILGPIGNLFTIEQAADTCIIVAGGIGLGPMIFWAEHCRAMGKRVLLIFGARSEASIPKKGVVIAPDSVICTDDGSEGFRGTTVDYLYSLKKKDITKASLFACGPMLMMKGCHEFALKNSIQCQVSMEQIMACGVGACMGCAVKTRKETMFARVCCEGPVFNSRDVIWT